MILSFQEFCVPAQSKHHPQNIFLAPPTKRIKAPITTLTQLCWGLRTGSLDALVSVNLGAHGRCRAKYLCLLHLRMSGITCLLFVLRIFEVVQKTQVECILSYSV